MTPRGTRAEGTDAAWTQAWTEIKTHRCSDSPVAVRGPGLRQARASSFLHRSPRLRPGRAALAAPMTWLARRRVPRLARGHVSTAAFWSTHSFTGALVQQFQLDIHSCCASRCTGSVALRTIGVAATVTVVERADRAADGVDGQGRRAAGAPAAGRGDPHPWASYLVKAYAWRANVCRRRPGELGAGAAADPSGPGYGVVSPATLTLAYLRLCNMILPVYAGREANLGLCASSPTRARPAGRSGRWSRRGVPRRWWPGRLHVLVDPRRLHRREDRGRPHQLLGNVIYDNVGAANNLPFAAARGDRPGRVMLLYLAPSAVPGPGEPGSDAIGPVTTPGRARSCSRATVARCSCSSTRRCTRPAQLVQHASRTFAWPPSGSDPALVEAAPPRGCPHARSWTSVEGRRSGARRSRSSSGRGGAWRCSVPVLRPERRVAADHPADRASRHRHRHRAQQRLPDDARDRLGFLTVVVGARDVLHRDGVQQRAGPAATARAVARAGLGRPRRRPVPTFRLVTFPMLRSALLAGALLAFGLSFDEIVVTTFTAGPECRRCRSGSSRTCSGPTRRRWSTSSRPCWCCCRAIPI